MNVNASETDRFFFFEFKMFDYDTLADEFYSELPIIELTIVLVGARVNWMLRMLQWKELCSIVAQSFEMVYLIVIAELFW